MIIQTPNATYTPAVTIGIPVSVVQVRNTCAVTSCHTHTQLYIHPHTQLS